MKATLLGLMVLLMATLSTGAAEPEVVFEDALKGKLGSGWEWLRENPKAWRHSEKGLEIRVEPGLAETVKNALVRKAPDRSQGKYAIEVTVEFTAAPEHQYEQAGITWYQGDKPGRKLVHEFIDGKTYVIPGRKPTETRLMQLRLVVTKDEYVAQYRPDAKGEWQTAESGKLPPGKDEKVSIQCYNGPADKEHWMRFSDFKVLKLPE
jgi:beta-xylosidase